jgi:hypothetical protein
MKWCRHNDHLSLQLEYKMEQTTLAELSSSLQLQVSC